MFPIKAEGGAAKLSVKNKQLSSDGSLMFEPHEDGYRLSFNSAVPLTPVEIELFTEYAHNPAQALIGLGTRGLPRSAFSASVRRLYDFTSDFMHIAAEADSLAELKDSTDALSEYYNETGVMTLGAAKPLTRILIDALMNECSVRNAGISGAVKGIYAETAALETLSFCIEENTNGDAEHPLILRVTCRVDAKELPLRQAIELLGNDARITEIMTRKLARAALASTLVCKIYNSGEVIDALALTVDEMLDFMNEGQLYAQCGIRCRIPTNWRRQRGSFSLGARIGEESVIGASELLKFDISLTLNGIELTEEDLKELRNLDSDVFMLRGHWIEVSAGKLKAALAAYEEARSTYGNGISLSDAIREYLASVSQTAVDDSARIGLELRRGAFLREITSRLTSPTLLKDVEMGNDFSAVLRPYQRDGVAWLEFMRKMGLGACLSDDMGLGKTVQVIAVLERIRLSGKKPSLIVIPASLIQNWKSELSKFAPKITYKVLHHSYGSVSLDYKNETDVYITTYAMVSRIKELREKKFECIVLDEAQAIKNPATLQSKAVRRLSGCFKIAMTGTPIENSPLDLWSIFSFLNPSLFGNGKEFLNLCENDSLTTEGSESRLSRLISPFILRRVKTDKTIIADLPEKIEMKSYCELTKKQALQYAHVTDALQERLLDARDMERRGLVLSSIMRLKQICNHPDQYAGGGAYLCANSGKTIRLVELCEEISSLGERVLVFTQFRELCVPLARILETVFKRRGLIINGGTSVAERGKIVETFNDSARYTPFIVLSLRAGGVGLNLTAANHVIHFDRWWNPAVENQATDRAFRIGQTSNVIVHKLITSGTLEEKIDLMIEQKRALADDLIGSGTGLTELSDDALMELISLRA